MQSSDGFNSPRTFINYELSMLRNEIGRASERARERVREGGGMRSVLPIVWQTDLMLQTIRNMRYIHLLLGDLIECKYQNCMNYRHANATCITNRFDYVLICGYGIVITIYLWNVNKMDRRTLCEADVEGHGDLQWRRWWWETTWANLISKCLQLQTTIAIFHGAFMNT